MAEGLDDVVRDIVRKALVLMMGDRRIKRSNGLIIGVPMVGDDG